MAHITRVAVLGEMASTLAHEVNQPLTAIATYAQACHRLIHAKGIDASETLDVLARISNEAVRAGEIIHGLKDLVRKGQTRREECDVNEVILDVQPLMQIDAHGRDVQLRCELAGSLPTVMVDRVQIQQVVINLVRNAIDSMAETPQDRREVLLRTEVTEEGDIEVLVADRGCGIRTGEGEHIFETFHTAKARGMGMGLSISRTIVASHGGRIGYSENPGGGTVFYFDIPPATGGDDVQ